MRVSTDEALILRRIPYGEKDMLLLVFTKYHGKKRVIAKGVRSITSRRGGHLDLFNVVTISLHESGGMDHVTEATTVHSLGEIKNSKALLYAVYYLAELLDVLTSDEVTESKIYSETVNLLTSIDRNKSYVGTQLRTFEQFLLTETGFWSDEIHGRYIPKNEEQQKYFFQALVEEIIGKTLKTKKFVR